MQPYGYEQQTEGYPQLATHVQVQQPQPYMNQQTEGYPQPTTTHVHVHQQPQPYMNQQPQTVYIQQQPMMQPTYGYQKPQTVVVVSLILSFFLL